MSQIGTLTTGAGIATIFSGQAQCHEYILLGDVDTANPLQGISVEIDGTPYINIQNSAALVGAFFKWMSQSVAGVVGLCFKVATGKIRKNTTYRFINNGATVPTVKVFSDSQNGFPYIATTKGINITSFEDFTDFSALMLTLPASVETCEIAFADGHKDTFTIQEVDALFAMKYPSEADGRLNACSVIDNRDQSISAVRVFAGAVAVTVLVIKLPDEAFQSLMAQQ
jgi:hypothetical protein